MRVVPPQTGAGLLRKAAAPSFSTLCRYADCVGDKVAKPEMCSTALLVGQDLFLESCMWWPAPSDGDGAGFNTGLKRRGSGHGVSRCRQDGSNLVFQI